MSVAACGAPLPPATTVPATTAPAATSAEPSVPSAASPVAPPPSVTRPGPPSAAPSTPATAEPTPSARVEPSAVPSVRPSLAPPSAEPAPSVDPAKFGYAAKGMAGEMLAFVPIGQLEYAVEAMDWDVVSTVAFFSLEATRSGTIADDAAWKAWNSVRMDRLIEAAHSHGSKVVMSLERFAWSSGQIRVSRELLADAGRRDRLARTVAEEVARRGVDGVNVDFEPIPVGQKAAFTAFMKVLRRELDRVAPGSQLTFCVTGHHESYDVAGSVGPDAADAVYLMGYHYAGTWSKRAGSTAPMGGPQYDVVDSVKSLLREVERHELIVGVPYYGHAWPTAGSRLNAATQGGGFDVQVQRALEMTAGADVRYDKVQQVSWLPYRARPCTGCDLRWYQLYFDDARSLGYKWTWITRNKLLGSGVWTIGFEGRPGPIDAAMREAFLRP